LERRLRAGEDARVETFLDSHPTLADDPDRATDLIVAEFRLRRELGQRPDPADWLARFPRWRGRLARRFEALAAPEATASLVDPAAQTTPQEAPGRAESPGDGEPALGRHEVFEEIGRGAMGVVYRARDPVLGRPVALKTIRVPQGMMEDPEAVKRFCREAQAAARLRHPHIVPVHGMGRHDGRPCFSMALITGGSLAGRMDEVRRDLRGAVALVEKVARAVHYAHEQGVIHRDLKPANILLDERGEPLVGDFGLAKFLDGPDGLSSPGQRLGTPAYMAPEQAAGHTWKVSPRSDVWALGVILFELLTGERPFRGPSGEAVFQQVLAAAPRPPRAVRPAVPRALEAVALRCLEREPSRRYPTAAALADDLARWLRGEAVRPHPGSRRRLLERAAGVGLAATAALLVLASLLAFARPPAAEPDRAGEADERDLAEGRAVELIGDAGPPRWQRWAVGGGVVLPTDDGDGAFSWEAFSPSALELVRDPCRGYRLSAEVRHENTERIGEVGLFAALSRQPVAGGAQCFCLTLTFDDFQEADRDPDGQPCSIAVLTLRRFHEPDGESVAQEVCRKPFTPAAVADPGTRPWRRLAIEVRPDDVRAFWKGERFAQVARADLDKRFQTLRRRVVDGRVVDDCPGCEPRFTPREGLGLYVARGKAAFRRVVVEPLP
jgi:serine/threonine-protein kinase